jgi:thioredoxin 1
MAQQFTKDSFASEVIEASKAKPVLVDFFATWCGPCQAQAPIVDEIAADFEGKAIVGKLDTDQAIDVARQYGVMSIPTLIVFKNGQPTERFTGVQEKNVLAEALNKNL